MGAALAQAGFAERAAALAQDGFALQSPGQRKYFRHPLGYPWTYGEIRTRRHRVCSYIKACPALVLGYHHLHLFDDARRKRKEWMASSSEKNLVAIPAKAKAAAATKVEPVIWENPLSAY